MVELSNTLVLPLHPLVHSRQVVELSDTAFYPDQIHKLSRTKILMGVHGAGMGNMIWMKPEKGGVVEIMVRVVGWLEFGSMCCNDAF